MLTATLQQTLTGLLIPDKQEMDHYLLVPHAGFERL
jgi:hypothetical protein